MSDYPDKDSFQTWDFTFYVLSILFSDYFVVIILFFEYYVIYWYLFK